MDVACYDMEGTEPRRNYPYFMVVIEGVDLGGIRIGVVYLLFS